MTALEQIEVADAHAEHLVGRQLRVEHDHRRHQLGHRGNRGDNVRAFGVDRLARHRIEHQNVGRGELELADVARHVWRNQRRCLVVRPGPCRAGQAD